MTLKTIVEGGKLAGDNGAGNAKARAPWDWPFMNLKTPCSSDETNTSCNYIVYDPFEGCGFSTTNGCNNNEEIHRVTFGSNTTLSNYDHYYHDILVKSGAILKIQT